MLLPLLFKIGRFVMASGFSRESSPKFSVFGGVERGIGGAKHPRRKSQINS